MDERADHRPVGARDRAGQGRRPDAGADDYVSKPFGMAELLARLRAAVRQTGPEVTKSRWVETDALRIDLAAKQVRVAGDRVWLTPIEWQIVELLVRNEGRLVSQRQVLVEVWGPRYALRDRLPARAPRPHPPCPTISWRPWTCTWSLDAPPALTTVVQAALREYL